MRMTLTKIPFLLGVVIVAACNGTPPVPEYSIDPTLTSDERSIFIDTLNVLSSDLRDSLNMVGLNNKVYASSDRVRGTVTSLAVVQDNVFRNLEGTEVAFPDHSNLDLQDAKSDLLPRTTPEVAANCTDDSSGPFRRVTSQKSPSGTSAFNWMQVNVYLPTGLDSGTTKAEAGGFLQPITQGQTATNTNAPYIYVGGFGATTAGQVVTAVDAGFQQSTGTDIAAGNGKWSLFFKVEHLQFPDANSDGILDDLFASSIRFPGGSFVRLEFFHFNNVLVVSGQQLNTDGTVMATGIKQAIAVRLNPASGQSPGWMFGTGTAGANITYKLMTSIAQKKNSQKLEASGYLKNARWSNVTLGRFRPPTNQQPNPALPVAPPLQGTDPRFGISTAPVLVPWTTLKACEFPANPTAADSLTDVVRVNAANGSSDTPTVRNSPNEAVSIDLRAPTRLAYNINTAALAPNNEQAWQPAAPTNRFDANYKIPDTELPFKLGDSITMPSLRGKPGTKFNRTFKVKNFGRFNSLTEVRIYPLGQITQANLTTFVQQSPTGQIRWINNTPPVASTQSLPFNTPWGHEVYDVFPMKKLRNPNAPLTSALTGSETELSFPISASCPSDKTRYQAGLFTESIDIPIIYSTGLQDTKGSQTVSDDEPEKLITWLHSKLVCTSYEISSGGLHTCGMNTNGQVYCWGSNDWGKIGNGNVSYAYVAYDPTAVSSSLVFTQISAGETVSCGLITTGSVYCWGTLSDSWSYPTPTLISTDQVFSEVTTGYRYACGITEAGKAYCWGSNNADINRNLGTLGNNSDTDSDLPVPVYGNFVFQKIDAKEVHTCGLTIDGKIFCWGLNALESGLIGAASSVYASPIPIQVQSNQVFSQISVGERVNCGLTTIGKAYCWGNNYSGQIGNNSHIDSPVPMSVVTSVIFDKISAGSGRTCALTVDGNPYCWGLNITPIFTYEEWLVPVAISGGVNFMQISSADRYTCGITTDAKSYCWNIENYGEFGLGDPGAGQYGTHYYPLPTLNLFNP